jgi:GGDEF domain-containing protein
VRSTDLVARVGPAEIAIVQHDVRSRDNALRLAQRIRAALADPVTVDGRDVTVAASIGISLAPSGSEGRTPG